MKKIIIIALLALGLIACQKNTSEDPLEETNEINETAEANENEEGKKGISLKNAFKKVDLALYDDVLDNYARFTEMSIDEIESATLEDVKRGAFDYFYSSKDFEGIFGAYYDLNDNGVKELLLALRYDEGGYVLIDLYTIVDGEVVSLFTDDMSAAAMYKRSGYNLLENGKLIYATASGAGDKYGIIYELQEEVGEYVEIYEVSTEEGDFSIIEKELENTLDINELDWQTIGKENKRTVYDEFIKGDFSAIEGVWENGFDNESSQVRIEGNKFIYENGDHLILEFTRDYSNESSSVFSLMDEDAMGGAGLHFYPAHSEIEFGGTVFPSEVEKDRFFVTQAEPPGEKGIYYKVSDLKD